MTTFLHDLRYALRMLRNAPAFAAAAMLTLALGIGANTAVFTVINAVLLRSLPYRDAARLTWMTETSSFYPQIPLSYPDYHDWKSEAHSFENMGAVLTGQGSNLLAGGSAQRVKVEYPTASLFPVLDVQPILGRGFLDDDDRQGAAPVTLLSYPLWQSQFGGDPRVVGTKITLDGAPYTVIGVMPGGFRFYQAPDLWIPLLQCQECPLLLNRGVHYPLFAVGRLKPGVSLPVARAEIESIQRGLGQRYPQTTSKYGAQVDSLQDSLVGSVRPQLLVLSVAMALILLIACANVANLLLSRSAVRRQEIAVRIALGAGSRRLIRQLLTESVVIGVLGGIAGIVAGVAAVRALAPLTSGTFSPLQDLQPDARVFVFAFALALVTSVLFGLAPAWQFTRAGVQEGLASGGRNRAVAMPRRVRQGLVIAQMMLAVVLLAGAGLLLRTFLKLQQVNLGFDGNHVLTFNLALPLDRYADLSWREQFLRQAVERLRRLPGVESAAVGDGVPILGSGGKRFGWEGMPAMLPHDAPLAIFDQVSPDYFRALAIPLLRGRTFTEQDTADAPHVVVVNTELARHIWPNADPLGKKIEFFREATGKIVDWAVVVGEVGNVKDQGPTDSDRYEIYIPSAQGIKNDANLNWTFLLRTRGDPGALTSAARQTFNELDRQQPIFAVQTMSDAIAASLGTQRMALLLVGIFAALAVVVAAVGIYGVIAYMVSQHTQEFGIRMALGAQPGDVLRMVLRDGLLMCVIGVAAGLALALVATHWLGRVLFQTSPRDPLTFVLVPVVLIAVAGLATWFPARRATRVDPMIALRQE